MGIYKFQRLQVTGDYAKLPVYIEALDASRYRLWRYEFYHLARIIPVSPVFGIEDFDGTIRDARVSAACGYIREQLKAVGSFPNDDDEFNSCLDAIKGFQSCDINGLAFIKDFQEIKALVEPVIELLRKPLVLKNWASISLWWKYGVKLTFQDCGELVHALTKLKEAVHSWREYVKFKNSLHSRYGRYNHRIEDVLGIPSSGSIRCNTRIVARPRVPIAETAIAAIGALLEDLDFKLSAEHLWDLLPFSFVVDWFVDIGGLLSKLDYLHTIDTYELRERIYSTHSKVTPDSSAYLPYMFSGTVLLDSYVRSVSPSFPFPPLGLDLTDAFRNHLWEGALLTVVTTVK